jgi:hypothetical protein
MGMGRAFAAVAIVFALEGAEPQAQPVPLPPDVEALATCAQAEIPGPPQGWITVHGERFTWQRPAECRLDPDVRFVHEGERWLCGRGSVSVSWGYWALYSFEPLTAQCRTSVSGTVAVVLRKPEATSGVTVWYLLEGDGHQPVISTSYEPGSKDRLDAAAFSGRLGPADPSRP